MDTFKYILFLNLIAIGFWPLTQTFFSKNPDKGWVYSKIIGLVILSWTIWFLSSIRLIAFSTGSSYLIFALLVCLVWGIKHRGNFLEIKEDYLKVINLIFSNKKNKFLALSEFIFIFVFILWNEVRAHNPDIFGLEKFEDYGFFLSAYKTEYFPPLDHFLAGESINYYYYGHYVTALLAKLLSIAPPIAYNLHMSFLFAITFTSVFSLSLAIAHRIGLSNIKSVLSGIFGAILVTTIGSLHYGLYLILKFFYNTFNLEITSIINIKASYYYPSATRFIPFTIHEFPIYSFIINDLHAHVANIPNVILLIALLFNAFCELANNFIVRRAVYFLLSSSFLVGLFYVTNSWDYAIYLLLIGICCWSFLALGQAKDGEFSYLHKKVLIKTFLISLFVVVSSCLFYLPFWLKLHPPSQGIGVVPSGGGSALSQLLIVWFLQIFFAGYYFYVYKKLFIVAETSYESKSQGQLAHRFVHILFFLSFLLIFIPEIIYVKDIYPLHFRANTMFKLTYQAWIMFGICIGPCFMFVWDNFNKISYLQAKIFKVLGSVIILLGLSYSRLAIYEGCRLSQSPTSLDGTNFIKNISNADYEAISWINKNIKGQPIIVEGVGESYSFYARIATFTGLPTVIGWPVHEWLWRGSFGEPIMPITSVQERTSVADTVSKRVADVKQFYLTSDIRSAKDFIERYAVEYVYLGHHERLKYPDISEKKFSELGEVVYSNNNTYIYKIFPMSS